MRTALALVVVGVVGFVAVLAGRPSHAEGERTIEGTVKDPAGVPIPAVWIICEGHANSLGDPYKWRSDAHGRFLLDGLPEGRAVLRFITGDLDGRRGHVVESAAGTRDLAVVVEPGPSLTVKIAGYVPPEDDPRWARLTWVDADGRRAVRYSPIRDDGWVRFVRLPKDRDLELWATAASDRAAHEAALRPGAEEVAVPSQPGLEIRGKVLVSPGESVGRLALTADAHPGFNVARGRVEEDGTFVIRNLPEGTYRVSAWFSSGRVSLPVVQQVAAGTKAVVFDLRGV